jgi:hypothetical protein
MNGRKIKTKPIILRRVASSISLLIVVDNLPILAPLSWMMHSKVAHMNVEIHKWYCSIPGYALRYPLFL